MTFLQKLAEFDKFHCFAKIRVARHGPRLMPDKQIEYELKMQMATFITEKFALRYQDDFNNVFGIDVWVLNESQLQELVDLRAKDLIERSGYYAFTNT
ncbi:MAG: hypothetical protein CTY35_03570 [Methylotenera sp.]|nr:MAG: hypothetical protein CTY35_03570 [Methylotenera sp.]